MSVGRFYVVGDTEAVLGNEKAFEYDAATSFRYAYDALYMLNPNLATAYIFGSVTLQTDEYGEVSYNNVPDVCRLYEWVETAIHNGHLSEEQTGKDAWRVLNGIQAVYKRAFETESRVYIA